MFLCFFLFVFSLLSLFSFSVHYIYVLLLLEVLLFSVYLFFGFFVSLSFGAIFLFCYLLVMVCMGGFSISVLVSVSRHYGRDFWHFCHIF